MLTTASQTLQPSLCQELVYGVSPFSKPDSANVTVKLVSTFQIVPGYPRIPEYGAIREAHHDQIEANFRFGRHQVARREAAGHPQDRPRAGEAAWPHGSCNRLLEFGMLCTEQKAVDVPT